MDGSNNFFEGYVENLMKGMEEAMEMVVEVEDHNKKDDIYVKMTAEIKRLNEWEPSRYHMGVFVEELKDSFTELGDLFENLVVGVKEDKELKKIVRKIIEVIMESTQCVYDFDSRRICMEELFDYAKTLEGKESKDKEPDLEKENILPQIQHMKHLLDIMERNIKGTSTDEDAIELSANAQNWSQDIEKLMEMINTLNKGMVAD